MSLSKKIRRRAGIVSELRFLFRYMNPNAARAAKAKRPTARIAMESPNAWHQR